jgi:hypothetical protein
MTNSGATMSKHLLPTAALLGLVSANANASTILLPPTTYVASVGNPSPAGSTGLGPGGAVGGIGGPISICGPTSSPAPCAAPSAGTLRMTVEAFEFGDSGDVYQAFVNGSSVGLTSGVPLFNTTPINCTVPPGFGTPPQSNLSCGIFDVPVTTGTFNFDINDQILSWIGFPSPYGGGTVGASFSPSGVTVTLEFIPGEIIRTPEPTALALLGSWLLGLGLWWRRKATTTSA